MNTVTKAERIYRATRVDCKHHLETWGYVVNTDGNAAGFNFVSGEEVICVRTLNAMDELLDKGRKHNETCKKLGVIDVSKYETESKILNMIDATIKNTRKAIAR